MKTLIEIFDDNQILNLVTSYMEHPDEVIFLYQKYQEHMINNPTLEKFIGVQVSYLPFDRGNLMQVLSLIKEDDCAFDIHGGNDFAIAMIAQTAAGLGVELYYPDFEKGKVYILEKGAVREKELQIPKLTVREIVRLYGGEVRNLPEAYFDDHGRKVVDACMKAKRRNNRAWVNFCKTMGTLSKKFSRSSTWEIPETVYRDFRSIFDDLRPMFSRFEKNGNRYFAEFYDQNYLILATDTGVAFEYETYYSLKDCGYFDDIDLRVNIDWNGGEFVRDDPNSELDVVASKDGRLVSVSCKAGKYDQQAVYEVRANATKFGGQQAAAILVTDLAEQHYEITRKAEEIDVLLLEYKDVRAGRTAEKIIQWIER